MSPLFSGVGVALVTIFDGHGAVDVPATADLAAQLTGRGVAAVLVAGTTGEAPALSPAERSALIRGVRDAVPADVPVLAGTGAPTGCQAVELTHGAFDAGADAALVLSPPWVADPRPYYDAVAKGSPGERLLAYHFPFASAPGIPVEVLADLPVAGIKDSSGDAERLVRTVETFDGDVYVGSSAVLSMVAGVCAAGAILTLANLEPERCIAALGGDGSAQRALLDSHLAAGTDFPVRLKELVAERFGVSGAVRIGR